MREPKLEIKKFPSLVGPLLLVTFEQSRSPKGVAQASLRWNTSFKDRDYRFVLQQVLRQLRENTIEAHGFDVMPPYDELYWLDPWPPDGDFHLHTTLKFGDGVTNLREHAAFILRMAEARGTKIRVPIRPIPFTESRVRFPSGEPLYD